MCLNQAVSELTTYCLWSACNLHFMRFPAVQSEEEKVLLTLSCWDSSPFQAIPLKGYDVQPFKLRRTHCRMRRTQGTG